MRKAAAYVLILLFALGAASCDRAPEAATTVLVVRHAEKASDADDSPLTEAGARRAEALARAAEGAGVQAIYSSQFKRNLDTARPLSERSGLSVTQMPVNLQNPGDYGRSLARDILEKHAGQTVVVVGHANTVAATVEGLTGRPAPPGDIQYADLFVVVVPREGAAKLIKAQYGL
jgi:broad specificity phosphatase PhoE